MDIMLTQLTIRDFAIIDHVEINFKTGLTVITGETGAGKSIIVDALDFLLGSRSSLELIRSNSNKAQIEGVFTLSDNLLLQTTRYLEKNGFEKNYDNPNELIISRELTNQGSKARINGSIANVSQLLYMREYLLDLHEQSSHTELLKQEKQTEFLDNYGDKNHKKLLVQYQKSYKEYQELKNKLTYMQQNASNLEKKIDLLEFQKKEISSANIKDTNEDVILEEEREILLNKKELIENANLIYESINGKETFHATSLHAILSEIKRSIARSNEYDRSFEPYLETIENIISEIKDLSSFVRNYVESLDSEGNTLKEIEERLDLFYRIKKKYGNSLTAVLEHLKKIENELINVEAIHELPLLEKSFKQKENEIKSLAYELTKSREKVAREFVNRINEELQTLGFKHAIFVIEFLDTELTSFGNEQIQYLFTANPDEPPKPLLKVASGGELSRIMLAIKSITVGADFTSVRTMIFDEIDIGVSGEIAASVAKKLYKISTQNQIICITHNPIIAAMADNHLVIEKEIYDGTTCLAVKEVMQNEKSLAIAALLTPEKYLKGGITEDAKEFAKSLLENAKKIKEKELTFKKLFYTNS